MSVALDLFGPPIAKPRTAAPATVKPLTLRNPNGAFRCVACGADAHFGFRQRLGEPLAGAWYCGAHKGQGD
ncbi:hypothetical protein [Lichenihabitans psoromatis]|uniref:hypothetical protein n=1 Tax=Lichenihabitans psoromatis TaxID=2528642 RepID=UPI0010385C1F|nr:hypothetical protein [Lichenihabitans psoromatis]